jgi:hypothetical protein
MIHYNTGEKGNWQALNGQAAMAIKKREEERENGSSPESQFFLISLTDFGQLTQETG